MDIIRSILKNKLSEINASIERLDGELSASLKRSEELSNELNQHAAHAHAILDAIAERDGPKPRPLPRGYVLALNINEQGTSHPHGGGFPLAASPGVGKVMRRINWKALERRPGEYRFGSIESDLAECRRLGITDYFIEPFYKSFEDDVPVPPYLAQFCHRFAHFNEAANKEMVGWTYAWWHDDPYVMDRLCALARAIGNRFNGDPIFAGIATVESAASLPTDEYPNTGYTGAGSVRGIRRYVNAIVESGTNALVFLNFIEGANAQMKIMAEEWAVKYPGKVALGGPDIIPGNKGWDAHCYPLYSSMKGKLPSFASMQHASILRNEHDQLIQLAVRDFGSQLIILNDDPQWNDREPYKSVLRYAAEHPL